MNFKLVKIQPANTNTEDDQNFVNKHEDRASTFFFLNVITSKDQIILFPWNMLRNQFPSSVKLHL